MARTTRGDGFATQAIRHQIYLQRYNTAVVRKMIALLNRNDASLIARIQQLDPDSLTRPRLEAQLEALAEMQARLGQELEAQLKPEVSALAAYEAQWSAQAAVAIGVRWDGPTQEQVRAAALSRPFQGVHLRFARLDEHMDELGRRRGALVRDTIRQAFLQGRGVDETVRLLRGTKRLQYRDGILEGSRRGVETIVRTAMNHTASAAREEVYKLNRNLLKQVMWVSVLDSRTTPICRARDGELYDVDNGPRPPAHPNCRSTTVPVFKGEDAPEKTTYAEWLAKQDSEFVTDLLGDTKAKLFREGDLSLSKFVDASGKEYTIEQLRAREAEAFKKAGLT